VLFDGVCGFCDRTIRWLVERDPEGRLCFAPLQGDAADALRQRHPEIPKGIDSLVYIDASDGAERIYLRSEAILRVWAVVDPANPWLRVLRRLPRRLADLAYAIFVRLRYRIFGRLAACRVPTPAERSRFID